MTIYSVNKIILLSLVLLVIFFNSVYASDVQGINKISLYENNIQIEFYKPVAKNVNVMAVEPFEMFGLDLGDMNLEKHNYPMIVNWDVTPGTITFNIPRFHDNKDLGFRKFILLDKNSDELIGNFRYATDFTGLKRRTTVLPWYADNIKGLTCPVDLDDFIALGTKYAVDNAPLSSIIDHANPESEHTIMIDGLPVPINMNFVREWMDSRYIPLTEAGINITLVVCNILPKDISSDHPLLHPDTALNEAPANLAFNMKDEAGLRYFRGAMQFIAERYTRPDKRYGTITGIIVGNEIQQHWVWHNQGRVPEEEVIRDYYLALRITDIAACSIHENLRVYVSMDHHWAKRGYMNDPLQEIRGDHLLEGINIWSKCEGDFPWHVAFHPYPDNLFEPRFWHDRSVSMRFDTPKITFKNLEVLPVFLGQQHMQYKDQTRRIILSEQGFHADDSEEGELNQAAAYAYAYHKVRHIPEIDAFVLHRHVSARDEGGLRLGLWTWDPEGETGFEPGRKMYIYDVFNKADTDQWKEAFAFALPIIGIDSWDEALPNFEIDLTPVELIADDGIVYNFIENMHQAKLINVDDFRAESVIRAAGWLAPAIFQHPTLPNVPADAVFMVDLTKEDEHTKLLLIFETVLTAESEDGVRFAVLVNDIEIWGAEQYEQDAKRYEINLSEHVGGYIKVTLRIEPFENTSYDWANWVMPLIIRVEQE